MRSGVVLKVDGFEWIEVGCGAAVGSVCAYYWKQRRRVVHCCLPNTGSTGRSFDVCGLRRRLLFDD